MSSSDPKIILNEEMEIYFELCNKYNVLYAKYIKSKTHYDNLIFELQHKISSCKQTKKLNEKLNEKLIKLNKLSTINDEKYLPEITKITKQLEELYDSIHSINSRYKITNFL